jgi:chorismate mutase
LIDFVFPPAFAQRTTYLHRRTSGKNMSLDLLNPKTALDLGNIRYTLIRLEDTIIFNLIERAQFPLNRSIYQPGAVPLPDFNGSFLDWLLTNVERTHGNF